MNIKNKIQNVGIMFNNTIKFIAFNLWIWEINLMWREKKSI